MNTTAHTSSDVRQEWHFLRTDCCRIWRSILWTLRLKSPAAKSWQADIRSIWCPPADVRAPLGRCHYDQAIVNCVRSIYSIILDMASTLYRASAGCQAAKQRASHDDTARQKWLEVSLGCYTAGIRLRELLQTYPYPLRIFHNAFACTEIFLLG
jgi:hypothetical protein